MYSDQKCFVTITTILQINSNFVNESLPIHLGTSKTKAYMINGTRTVYLSISLQVEMYSDQLACDQLILITVKMQNLLSFPSVSF